MYFGSRHVFGIIPWTNPFVILAVIGLLAILAIAGVGLYFVYEHLYWR